MGCDWRTLGWWEYQISLAAYIAANSEDGGAPEPDLDRLRRFTAAHSLH